MREYVEHRQFNLEYQCPTRTTLEYLMPEHNVEGDRRPNLSVAMSRRQQEPVTHHDDQNRETGKLLKGFVSLLCTFARSSFC